MAEFYICGPQWSLVLLLLGVLFCVTSEAYRAFDFVMAFMTGKPRDIIEPYRVAALTVLIVLALAAYSIQTSDHTPITCTGGE